MIKKDQYVKITLKSSKDSLSFCTRDYRRRTYLITEKSISNPVLQKYHLDSSQVNSKYHYLLYCMYHRM